MQGFNLCERYNFTSERRVERISLSAKGIRVEEFSVPRHSVGLSVLQPL